MQDTWSQRFHETMFIVVNNSSLELDGSHSCLHVNGLKPLNCKLKKIKASKFELCKSHPHWTCTRCSTVPFSQTMAFVTFLKIFLRACVHAQSLQLCPILCNPMDYSPPVFSVHGILQERILGWVAMPSFQGFFPTQGSHLHLLQLLYCRQILFCWATREALFAKILHLKFKSGSSDVFWKITYTNTLPFVFR